MPKVSRRSLLISASALAGVTALPSVAFGRSKAKSRKGVVLGAFRGIEQSDKSMIYELRQIDLDSGKRRLISMTFFPHGIAFDPKQPNRALMFEKKGLGAAEVDLKAGRIVRPIPPTTDRKFYGHGVFTSDAKFVLSTEIEQSTHSGVLTIRDGRSLKFVDQLSTFGMNPHDCCLTDGGKTLVVTNGGGDFPNGDAPSIAFIDLQSRKLLERVPMSSPRINAGHVLVARDRSVAVVSAPRDGLPQSEAGALSLRHSTGTLSMLVEPAEVAQGMHGETLSLSLHEASGHLAVTNPRGDQLTFWKMADQKLVKVHTLSNPRGVTQTLDGNYFLVSHGPQGSIRFYSPKTADELPHLAIDDAGIAGSHLYIWRGRLS